MRKILLYILSGTISISLLSSCNKFLDLKPESSATTGNAYNTKDDIEAALVGAYSVLYTEYFIWDNVLLGDIRSDNAYSGGDAAEVNQYDAVNVSTLNIRIFYSWQQLFLGVARANLVLAKIPEINDPKLDQGGRREQIIGEAKFLRALFYSELVKQYGGVPLITSFGSVDPASSNVARATEKEIYDAVIADLEDALTKLPDSYESHSLSISKATKGAANALMAKVYAQKADRDYNKVLQYCDAVINSPAGYQLHPSYPELFDGQHYDNNESILLTQFIANTPQSNWGPQLYLPPSLTGDSWRKYGTPSKNLVKAYDDEGDAVRKAANILFEDAEWSDEHWKPCPAAGPIPFLYKWKNANGWSSGDNLYLFRLGDILLLKAEALNELDQPEPAKEIVKTIRHRVGLEPITATTKEALRMAILKERRLELAFEGQRWTDLIRANQLNQVMNNLHETILTCDGGSTPINYNLNNNKWLLPIPQSEMNRNNKLVQNPGY